VLAGFGWAKPVPVNAYNLKHPIRDMAWVAVAGPISNFLVAFIALVALVLAQQYVEEPFFAGPIIGVLRYVYLFNVGLGIFNLIPLPPLDGGHFLPYLFPRASWTSLRWLEQYGPIILILLVMTNMTRFFMAPLFGLLNNFFIWLVRLIL